MSSPSGPSPAVLYRPLLLASFGFTFLTFGLPIYSKALGASALEIGGLYAIFTAALLVLRPAVGWGVDRFGRRRFLIAALLGYSASMLAFALARDLAGLYLARLLQGVASSLMWVTVFTVVADLANPHDRGRVMGRVNESTSRGEIIGVVLGFGMLRLLGNQNGWVVSFLVYAGLALVAAWLAWKKVPETRPPTSPQTSPGRVVPPGMLRLMVVVFATGFGMGLISPIYMVYLQDKFTTDISLLAWAFFPAGILYTVLPSRMGGLSDRVGRAPLMAGGLAVAGAIKALQAAMSATPVNAPASSSRPSGARSSAICTNPPLFSRRTSPRMRIAVRPATVSRSSVPRETPPITWSEMSCQRAPLLASGCARVRSSTITACPPVLCRKQRACAGAARPDARDRRTRPSRLPPPAGAR